jgi:fatty acid desaturase
MPRHHKRSESIVMTTSVAESKSSDSALKLAQEPISAWRLLRDIATDWGALLLALALARPESPLVTLCCVLVIGVHQHALAVLGHEATHFTISKNKWVNDTIGNVLFFYPLGVTISGYRRFHIQHHLKLNSPQDPEWPLRIGRLYKPRMSRLGFVAMFVGDLVGFGLPSLYRLGRASRPGTIRNAIGIIVFWVVSIGLIVHVHQFFRLAVWLFSLCTVYRAISRIRVWCEHIASDSTHRHEQSPIVAYLFFPHNIGFHYEHHAWPYLSYQKLPAARLIDSRETILTFTALMKSFGRCP